MVEPFVKMAYLVQHLVFDIRVAGIEPAHETLGTCHDVPVFCEPVFGGIFETDTAAPRFVRIGFNICLADYLLHLGHKRIFAHTLVDRIPLPVIYIEHLEEGFGLVQVQIGVLQENGHELGNGYIFDTERLEHDIFGYHKVTSVQSGVIMHECRAGMMLLVFGRSVVVQPVVDIEMKIREHLGIMSWQQVEFSLKGIGPVRLGGV